MLPRSAAPLFALITLGCEAGTPSVGDAGRGDVGPDAPDFGDCVTTAAIVAGTPETDPLADAPARCGAPAYAWLRSGPLGEVTLRDPVARYAAEQIAALAGAADIVLPEGATHSVRLERFAYTTQDRGELVSSSAILALPDDLPSRADLDIVLLLHGTTGYGPGCGPSAILEWQILAAAVASFGYVVVEPDFLGLESLGEPYGTLHPYFVGEATAIAALDSVRAARSMLAADDGPACGTARVALFGASQGGHAAFLVDRFAPYYARELAIVGGVAGVPPTNLVEHATRALTAPTRATPNFVASMVASAPWYGLGDRVDEVLVDALAASLPSEMASTCSPDSLQRPDALEDMLEPAFIADVADGGVATLEPWGCPIRENDVLETSIPRLGGAPLLVILGELDREVLPEVERASFPQLCAAGYPLAYLECEGAEHVDAIFWSVDASVAFLRARFAGEALSPDACAVAPAVRCSGTPAAP